MQMKLSIINAQFKKVNNFFNLYEKIWLAVFISAGIAITFIAQESLLHFAVLICGLLMEITLAKRSRICFIFVLLNSTGLIIIGFTNLLYSEMLINLLFWIPYAIIGYILWNKNIDRDEHKNLTVVRTLKWWQTALLATCITATGLLWSIALRAMGDSQPVLDALSTVFQFTTGILILTRLREQWLFWIGYILFSATMWILFNYWVMLIISLGYLTNSIYGLIQWSQYINKHKKN